MISVRLAGGLGNQIFQLSAAILLQSRYGGEINIDSSGLGAYNVPRQLIINKLFDIDMLNAKVDMPILMRLVSMSRVSKLGFVGYNDASFKKLLKAKKKPLFPIHLDGYFQEFWSKEDFDKVVGILKNVMYKNSQKLSNRFVIHCRGGDFLKDSNLNIMNFEWYKEAVSLLIENHDIPCDCEIVCEDIIYGRSLEKYLNNEFDVNFSLKQKGTVIEDFLYLKDSKFLVAGNSTFAFWASAFSQDPQRTIAPINFSTTKKRPAFNPKETLIKILGESHE